MKSYTEEERLAYAKSIEPGYPPHIMDRCHTLGRASIGNDGFGWIRQPDGSLYKMPHRGNVVIGKDVSIGDYVCIDRAVNGSTVIGDGTKIDNLVHIAHGAKIGKYCLIVAGTIIGGSAEIGDYSYIGMGAKIKNKVKIGSNVVIGAGAVVLTDVPDNQIWAGVPAKFLKVNENTYPK